MIQDYGASQRPAWRLVGQEALGFVAAAALLPFGIRRPECRTPRRRDLRVVGDAPTAAADPAPGRAATTA